MRYSKEHAETVRRQLIREGGKHIKQRGILGAGVDGIARGLGLTGAALYTHFESKEAFLRAILSEELGATARRVLADCGSVNEFLARYMSLGHARAAAPGCVLPAITADVARGSDELREAFSAGLSEVVDALQQELGGQRELALATLASAVGAVALARALPSDRDATEVLDAARELISGKLSTSGTPTTDGAKHAVTKASKPAKRGSATTRKPRK